jgi:threonine dehydratase
MKVLGIDAVVAAKQRIYPYISQTPLLTSALLNKWLGHRVIFKAECLQKIGAFKARGACNTIAWLREHEKETKRIVANSSGNHAQAVAWAAAQFGLSSTIFMPRNVSRVKAQATAAYGAEVVFCETREEVDGRAADAAREEGTYWVPPYNHEQVIAGQGTAAFEALFELGGVDAVFAPCGGGGLLSGTLISTRALSPKAQVIGAEPLNANDAAESLRQGAIQQLQSVPRTLADGAMTIAVGDITFEYLKQLDDFYEIDEDAIVYWAQWLNHLLKVRIEPTSAMAMEAVRNWLAKQKQKRTVLVILSGGNVDQKRVLEIWAKDYLTEVPGLQRAY